MSTFAVTSPGQVLDSVNYLLSNLNTGNATGNITVPDGTLVANVTTGAITPFNTPGGTVYSYLNQYINLRYSNNASGTDGFSTVPTNFNYFGIYNSATPTPSANPAAYQWQQVAGGFGTTKTIYYSALGGRQVQWAAAASPPSSNFVESQANVAIDLDVVTTAAGTPGERGPIAMAYVVTTADPNTASSATLTGWFESSRDNLAPPIGTGLTPPVAGDTATFIYGAGAGTPSGTFSYNGSVWNIVVPQVISGNVLVANSTPGSAITNASISGSKIGVNTIANTNIQTDAITADRIAGNTITGNKIAANTITANNIQVATITATQIAANTITANNIAANTITATQISSDYLYTGNIVSFGADLGNISSPGYWLQNATGNARFGGNVSIGNNLSVAGLITTGSLNANTVNTNQVVTGAISNFVDFQSNSQITVRNSPIVNDTWYDLTFPGLTITTTQDNQTVFLWFQQAFVYLFSGTGPVSSTTNFVTLSAEIIRQPAGGGAPVTITSFTRLQTLNAFLPSQSTSVNPLPVPGLVDVVVTPGVYEYKWRMKTNNATTPQNITFTSYQILPSTSTTGTLAPITLLGLVLKR